MKSLTLHKVGTSLKVFFLCDEDEKIHWSDIMWIGIYFGFVAWIFILMFNIIAINLSI